MINDKHKTGPLQVVFAGWVQCGGVDLYGSTDTLIEINFRRFAGLKDQ